MLILSNLGLTQGRSFPFQGTTVCDVEFGDIGSQMKDILCINIHAFSVIYSEVNMEEHILKVHFSGMPLSVIN
jgi:hypothetical protein